MLIFKPSLFQIQKAPQLAALHMASLSLEMLKDSLTVAHPHLECELTTIDRSAPSTIFLADSICRLADSVISAILIYRSILANSLLQNGDQLPDSDDLEEDYF